MSARTIVPFLKTNALDCARAGDDMTNLEMLQACLNLQAEYDRLIFESYSLPEGYESIRWVQIQAALLDEIGELNHEIKSTWCWWKKTQLPADPEKVTEEFADVMHFCLLAVLYKSHWDKKERQKFADGWQKADGSLPEVSGPPSSIMLDLISSTDDAWRIGCNLRLLIHSLGFSVKQAFAAYQSKNSINRCRIQQGY